MTFHLVLCRAVLLSWPSSTMWHKVWCENCWYINLQKQNKNNNKQNNNNCFLCPSASLIWKHFYNFNSSEHNLHYSCTNISLSLSLSLSIISPHYYVPCSKQQWTKNQSVQLSHTCTHTPETFQVYKIHILHFILCMYCSLSLSHSLSLSLSLVVKVYIFPPVTKY